MRTAMAIVVGFMALVALVGLLTMVGGAVIELFNIAESEGLESFAVVGMATVIITAAIGGLSYLLGDGLLRKALDE